MIHRWQLDSVMRLPASQAQQSNCAFHAACKAALLSVPGMKLLSNCSEGINPCRLPGGENPLLKLIIDDKGESALDLQRQQQHA
jgi:hypothetical protein